MRCISFVVAIVLLETASSRAAEPPDSLSATLASRIDARLNATILAQKVEPAPRSSDAEFLRRLYLDLVGRIPTVSEARSFLDDARADKRSRLVDSLLASNGYIANSARVWRSLLAPQATANLQTQYLGVSLEAWLRQQLRGGASDAALVRELLTARLDYLDWTSDKKPMPAPGLSPVGFYQANDLKPETVSSAAARSFLGLKLECALCHDHPFDKWTKKQAWEMAAFFAGVSPLTPDVKAEPGLANRRQLRISDGTDTASARFLDGAEPDWGRSPNPRDAFAAWLTGKENPYFARVMANRVWASLFGVGLVEPVDDWGPHNPPSHPELLDDLAAAYRDAGFNPKVLIRAIVLSDAYQRTSRLTQAAQSDPRKFARMNVKGLSAEQLFDSLAAATGYRAPTPLAADAAFGWPAQSPRGQFLAKFGGGAARTDMQVSILQALSLMNGEWLARQTDPAASATVKAVAAAPFLTDAGRIEALFLGTLSRRPTAAEADRCLAHFRYPDDKARAVADMLWVLVNSQEFLVNH